MLLPLLAAALLLTPGFAVGDRCADDGPRYQLVYATSGADRRVELAPTFQKVIDGIERVGFGGYRALRIACGSRFLPILPGTGYQGIVAAIPPEIDRKFLIFVDDTSLVDCGWGSTYRDDQPGQENQNNVFTTYALVWSQCWFGTIPSHEIFHSLGAVQPQAPFGQRDFHCDDPRNQDGIFNCSQASYYDPSPPPGAYLADHWNTANSRFLDVLPYFPIYLPEIASW